ncbi:MAG: LysR family transcriptional regulator [Treponema sp.]|nr:LysR family transcriptional regulator [Treponema sp.]
MTLQQLKYAVAVAECLNMTEAAKKVFISQPSLTAAIHDLEAEMGVELFLRTSKGVSVTNDGDVFLGYARQVLEQASLLQERFLGQRQRKPKLCVSCQHYSFAVEAFVDVIREYGGNSYDFSLRETETYRIIEDVSRLRSEIGVLYTSAQNEEYITRLLKKSGLVFEELFVAKPHVFVSSKNPLASKERIQLEDLKDYPCLTYEQGDHNSFYFSEELLSSMEHDKNIKVCDRATLFNLVIGLDGYTICSGVISAELNGENIVARPLDVNEYMRIGTIRQKDIKLSPYAESYLKALRKHTQEAVQKAPSC